MAGISTTKRVAENRTYVAKRRQETVCELCGAQPIQWHDPENTHMGWRWVYQVARMANHAYAIATIEAEIAACQALCMSCHARITKSGSTTHCKRGHERTLENTRVRPNGWYDCKLCARELERKRRNGG